MSTFVENSSGRDSLNGSKTTNNYIISDTRVRRSELSAAYVALKLTKVSQD